MFHQKKERGPLIDHDLASFGSQLKRLRTERHLSQQQLAQTLGVHRNAIGRWERGEMLPGYKGIVLELARHLSLNEEETRQLLEASLTALAPHWSVPLPRNPFFTGREPILERLHAQLGLDQRVALTQASTLHGLGGVGKTQIALEYAYRYGLEYSAVCWIGAETEESIVASLLQFAQVLGLPGREDTDHQRVIAAVQHWLSTHRQWLLIWDNVEDLELLQCFLPVARGGALLFTTRRRVLGTLASGVDLWPMELEEALLFLLRRAKVLSLEATTEELQAFARRMPAQYAAAAELVTALGGLPLALDQAGAYLEATQCGLPTYLELFHTRRAVLLQQRGEGACEHPASVSTTFTLAMTALTQRHPAVLDVLHVCAFLQPDSIPEEIFRQGGEHLGTTLGDVCGDALEWNQVVGVACAYSLLHRQPEEQTLSIHRLVQAVLLDSMTDEEREQWLRRTLRALEAVFPEVLPATAYVVLKQCERLAPHVLLCLQQPGSTKEALSYASLAYKVARYQCERGQYRGAEPLYLRALQIQEQTLGSTHPAVASTLAGLAHLYRVEGNYAQAEPLYLRALQIQEQALGPTHPAVASSLNGLANLYSDQGKYPEVEALRVRTLRIWEQALGPDHPYVAASLNNLAIHYRDQGKYGEAEVLCQRALHIYEQALGPDDPKVALVLTNLANLSSDQGKDGEVQALYQRALQIYVQALGPEHHLIAGVLNGLANLSRNQGKYAEAEALYQRALQIREQTLGPEHPWLRDVLNGLANLYRDQQKFVEAEALYQRVLSIQEQRIGLSHPDAAETLHNLALLRQQQGNLNEAMALAERALASRSQALGDLHPHTVASRELYTHLVQERECAQVEVASRHYQQALPDPGRNKRHVNGASSPLHQAVPPVPSEDDPLQGFLEACCELHPRAWCRIRDLRQAYEHWVEEHHERFPLPRRAFAAQLKAHGCSPDRTSTARIWRGITLRQPERDKT
jgi:tetratricopeptide (TPR) repeat protein/transcriptional regulator with XRE-family HTH domain